MVQVGVVRFHNDPGRFDAYIFDLACNRLLTR